MTRTKHELFDSVMQISRCNTLKELGYPVNYVIEFFGQYSPQLKIIYTIDDQEFIMAYNYYDEPSHYISNESLALSRVLAKAESKATADIKQKQLVESAKSKLTEDELEALKTEVVKIYGL
jgi:hypothetical protein